MSKELQRASEKVKHLGSSREPWRASREHLVGPQPCRPRFAGFVVLPMIFVICLLCFAAFAVFAGFLA